LISKYPGDYKFITLLQKIQNENKSFIEQFIQGRIAKKIMVSRQQHEDSVKNLVLRFKNSNQNNIVFLMGIAYYLNI
jgi:hypothetical protein